MKTNHILFAFLLLLTSCAKQYPEAGNPKEVARWVGYQNNNVIIVINTDKKVEESMNTDAILAGDKTSANYIKAMLAYVGAEYHQTKKWQNVYLYFYSGNAPISLDQFGGEQGELNNISEYIKMTKPYYTITIMGDGEYDFQSGYSG